MKWLHSTLQTRDLYGYAIKSMDDNIYFLKIPLFLQEVNTRCNFSNKGHLFILDGHGSHVTLEAIEQAQTFRLNTFILPSHTSHAL